MPHRGGGSCDAGDRRPFSSGDDFQSLVFWITSCVLLIFLNTFFTFRTQPLTISAILMQILVLPIGRFMAATLPTDHYNFFGWRFSLNPGPFNMKEYVIITIFANCGVSTGGGDAYSISAITVLLGYGWAGILRRYLVDPVDMWWPSNFAQVSLFRAMIQGEASIKKVVVVCGESGSHEPSYEKNKNLHEDGGDGERPSPEGEEGVEEDEEHA